MSALPGRVFLVGAGPGDPELITVRGRRVMREADVIVHDRLIGDDLLRWARPETEIISIGPQPDREGLSQDEINRLLIARARAGQAVCRLKGGDPMVFGRGGEEAEALAQAGIPFEIVPGVSSPLGAAATAAIPLTRRDLSSSVLFIAGHEDPGKSEMIEWERAATAADTLVVFMGRERLALLAEEIQRHGRDPDTPAAVVQWATTPRQRTVVGTLRDIAQRCDEAGLGSPALFIVGDVVRLREKLEWFERRPLFGRRVVVTRARLQAEELAEPLEDLGAEVLRFPVIAIQPLNDNTQLDAALRDLEAYEWVVFTSVNGVDAVKERIREARLPIGLLIERKICAIGPATAQRLARLGANRVHVPPAYVAESAAAYLAKHEVAGKRVLLPRAAEAREILPERLRELGAQVDVVTAYETVAASPDPEPVRAEIAQGRVHAVTFTSSSTVRHFVQCLGGEFVNAHAHTIPVATIGPITSQTARDCGLNVAIEAKEYSIPGLVAALVDAFAGSVA